MKLVKKSERQEMQLWDFAKSHLPPSLKAIDRGVGSYGVEYVIGTRQFYGVGKDVAIITDCMDGASILELVSPEYFSDMETMVKQFEAASGKEVIFEYWQS